jgi:hypothetical protein
MATDKTTTAKQSVFATLNAINVNEHTEQKNGLTYLSWAWAWQMVKKNYPASYYTIYETADGRPYFDDGRTCWVKTGVTIEGLEHIEYLPIMDYNNRSIPVEKVTSMDMNKAIQRSLTKAAARHGLGLYIYAGEDLPDAEQQAQKDHAQEAVRKTAAARKAATEKEPSTEQAPAPAKPKLSKEEMYWKVVEKEALGIKAKNGSTYREAWINIEHPTKEQLEKFDHDVENVKLARQIPIINQ